MNHALLDSVFGKENMVCIKARQIVGVGDKNILYASFRTLSTVLRTEPSFSLIDSMVMYMPYLRSALFADTAVKDIQKRLQCR